MRSGLITIVRDEWRRVWHDEGVSLIVVFALFIYGISYSLGYGGEVMRDIPIAVVGCGQDALSQELVEMFDASPELCVAYRVGDMASAERLLRQRRVSGIVALSPTLASDVEAERQGRVAILGDASYFLSYRGVVEGAVATIQQKNGDIIEARSGEYSPSVIYRRSNLFNSGLGYGVFVMPAIILLIVQQTALIGIGMLSATRRERGECYPSSSALAITVGRTVVHLAIYALTLGFMLTVHYSLFGYPMRGEWWECMAVILPYLLAVSLFAQMVGVWFRRRESSILWLLWLSIPFLLVSGVSLPKEAFPGWLYLLGRVVPSSSAVDCWIAVQSCGASLSDIGHELTLLWVLVVLYGAGAMLANRKGMGLSHQER